MQEPEKVPFQSGSISLYEMPLYAVALTNITETKRPIPIPEKQSQPTKLYCLLIPIGSILLHPP